MLPKGYNPKNYGGKVWWNEENPRMRAIWGTQADYDRHIEQGGTWKEYVEKARIRMADLKEQQSGVPGVVEGHRFRK